MGCFNITNLSLSPILTNWMELTLCKQLCLGQGTQYAGIQNNACFCLNDTKLNEMTTLTSSECSSLCPGNIYQYCGTGDAINVFSLGKCWYIDYNFCHLICSPDNRTIQYESILHLLWNKTVIACYMKNYCASTLQIPVLVLDITISHKVVKWTREVWLFWADTPFPQLKKPLPIYKWNLAENVVKQSVYL